MRNVSLKTNVQFHYAWVVVFAGSVAVFCCLGLARFAFGMLLPSISEGLGLDYGQRGILGTGYLVGYLIMVATTPVVSRRVTPKMSIVASLLVISVSMLGMAASDRFEVLCVFYFVTGLGSGGAFVQVMSLASRWFLPSHRGLAAGLLMAGAGAGIVVSGIIVPLLVPVFGFATWQLGWLALSGFSMMATMCAFFAIRNTPEEMGLEPFGYLPEAPSQPLNRQTAPSPALIICLGGIYAIYGATYMIYTSFIVTSMVDSYAASPSGAGSLWAWAGFLSIFSGTLFGWLSDRIGRRGGLAAAFAALFLAYLLVAWNLGYAGLFLSLTLFGLAAWSVPTIIAAAAGDYYGAEQASSRLAVITLIFAAGQAIGPITAGFFADLTGSFSAVYGMSSGLAVMAVVLSMILLPRS